jgi:arylformamidase
MRILDISRPLTNETAVFPGDEAFSIEYTMLLERGDSCNVSCVRGSAHAGTHVDLPRHVLSSGEPPPLTAFVGPAVVIEVEDWEEVRGLRLDQGLRVLFKTRNSRTPFTVFDDRFEVIPSWIPEWLRSSGAVLVGVDGPSVDATDSKELPNHRALMSAGIAILENLDLSDAQAGEAELIALPLNIPDADATWVRAVLLIRD